MRLFLRLLGFVRPYWRRLLAALVCMAIFATLSAVSLGMILPFMNVLFEEGALLEEGASVSVVVPVAEEGTDLGDGGARGAVTGVTSLRDEAKLRLLGLFAGDSPGGTLGKICVALLVVFFVKSVFGYLQTFLMITVEQGVIRDIRDRLFGHLNELSLSFFHGQRTGQLISRITNDVTLVRRALVASFVNLFRESLLTALYLALAVWISWRLALITFVVLPPIILVIARVGRRLRKRSGRIQERMADITSTLEESISGVRVVKAFGMEKYERERFFGHTWRYFRAYVRMELLGALAGPLTEYMGVIGVVVVLWYGGRQVLLSGTVSPDWFIIFLAATLSTMQPLRKLSKANNELQIGLAAAGRIFSILDIEPTVTSALGAARVESFNDRIAYDRVHFRYGRGDEVLRAIDLEIGTLDISIPKEQSEYAYHQKHRD